MVLVSSLLIQTAGIYDVLFKKKPKSPKLGLWGMQVLSDKLSLCKLQISANPLPWKIRKLNLQLHPRLMKPFILMSQQTNSLILQNWAMRRIRRRIIQLSPDILLSLDILLSQAILLNQTVPSLVSCLFIHQVKNKATR